MPLELATNAINVTVTIAGATKVEELSDVPSFTDNGLKFLRVNNAETAIEYVASSADVAWGAITGTLNDQTDLKSALDLKANASSIPTDLEDLSETANTKYFTSTEKSKLSGIASGAEVNVQSDWNATEGDSLILNKPTLLALGELSTNAYRGDRGKTAYDHSQLTSGNPHSVSASDVNCLSKTNTTEFTPTADYHPATKKYVDDNSGAGSVTSVFGRSGAVTATSGDYNFDLITDGTTNKAYTATEKSKLSGIEASANNYALPTATGAVLGGVKVGTRLSIADGVLSADSQTDNNFTTALKNKLDGVADGAEVNVNADWNSGSGDSQIMNKPTLGTSSALNVPATGDAGTGEVVKGDDTRLTNARTPSSHVHGNISNAGAIGTTTGLPIKTTTDGVLTVGAFGTSAGEFAEGNHSHSYLTDVVNDTTPQLGGDLDCNEKNIDMDAIPSSDNTALGDITNDHVAGETLAFGNVVYLKSDGKWWKAVNTAIATTGLTAMALESKNANEAVKVLLRGFVRDDDYDLTVGGAVYLGSSGAITQTAPTTEDYVIQLLGYATHADRFYFNPSVDRIEYKA